MSMVFFLNIYPQPAYPQIYAPMKTEYQIITNANSRKSNVIIKYIMHKQLIRNLKKIGICSFPYAVTHKEKHKYTV